MILPYHNKLKQSARDLRSNMTDAEQRLWAELRLNHLAGFRFYRQRPLGGYIADFYSPKARLVIEIDGGQHYSEEGKEYDRLGLEEQVFQIHGVELPLLRIPVGPGRMAECGRCDCHALHLAGNERIFT